MTRLRFLSTIVLLFAFVAPAAHSQSMFGTLSGIVTDVGGAVIAEARVTVKNVDSGEVRTSISNREGFFSFSTLPAAAYEVTASAKGFSRYHAAGVTLTGGESRSMTIELQVGQASETVEVRGTVTELAPVSGGEKAYTISAADLQQLSLVSRDATEIVTIMPGAILKANGGMNRSVSDGQVVGMNWNGPLGNANVNSQGIDITMDGGHTFDPGASGNSVPVTANSDMISEVKILTSNFTADNPKGPVVVNTVSKAGGKDFHGDMRFYARNGATNAADKSQNANNIKKPGSSYYYPGFGVGGPLIIPGTEFNRNRNKLFFHESYEYYKQMYDYLVDRAFVPTADMLNGDFSALASYNGPGNPNVGGGTMVGATPTPPNLVDNASWSGAPWRVFDPRQSVSAARLSNCTIGGGKLSPACIDPNAQALLKAYLPEPTTPNGTPVGDPGYNFIKDYTGPMNSNQNMAKVNWNLSDQNNVTVVYNRERQTVNWVLGLWINPAADNAVPSPTPVLGQDQSDFVSATFVHVFSPSLSSETKFNFTHLSYPEFPQDSSKTQRAGIADFNLKGIYGPMTAPIITPWGSGYPNLGMIGTSFHPKFDCYTNIPAVGEDLTKVFGRHDAKVGFYLEDILHAQDNWAYYMGNFTYANWGGANSSVTGNLYADTLMGVGMTNGYSENAQPPKPTEIDVKTLSFYAQDSWRVTSRLTLQYGMRFDHYGKPYQPEYGLAIFNPKDYNDDPAALDNNTGVEWHSQNPEVPLSGASSRLVFFSPRLGAALDVFGTGRTIARGGWGLYRTYDSVQSRNYTDPGTTALGSATWTCGANDPLCPSWEDIDTHATPNPTWGKTGLGPGLKAVQVIDPKDDEQPLVSTFSVTIDQKLPVKMNAEISYVGNTSSDIQTQVNMNRIPLGTLLGKTCTDVTCQATYRTYHNYEAITQTVTAGKARFDSLQASVQRNSGFATVMLNYTFSKALGDGVLGTTKTSGYNDYGVSEFYGVMPENRTHVLSAAYVFELPKLQGANALARQVLGGWTISGITQVESGANLTSSSSGWNLGFSAPNQPDYLGTPDIQVQPLITCDPRKGNPSGTFLNGKCFSAPPGNGVNGTTKMPYLPGPMFWKSDLTTLKNFKIGEKQSLQLRVAAFNFLNHGLLSFASGDSNLKLQLDADGNAPTNFGKATIHYGQRIMEFGAKYSF